MSGAVSVVWLFPFPPSRSRVPPSYYDGRCHHGGGDSSSRRRGQIQSLVRLPVDDLHEKDLHKKS
jgi:hypothetical protein